ncbi:MAG: aspartate kinase, partial [Anaerolineae bacterium]
MSMLVMKFGGTSVGSAEALGQAAGIVEEQAAAGYRLVVVVSAMSGVTDALIRGAITAAAGDKETYRAQVRDLRTRHYGVVDALFAGNGEQADLLAAVDAHLDEFAAFCHSVHVLGEVTPRAMDAITSLGERINARILAALLRARGTSSQAVEATDLIVTDGTFQDAVPLLEPSRARSVARLGPLLEAGTVPVVTGFIGATEAGVTTTLGRGGSDFSASILGVSLDADEVWIWTDVDGVMSADPRL